MTTKEANYFVNTLSSKHVGLQNVLRRFVNGDVATEDLEAAEASDSRAGAVVAVLRAIKNAEPKEKVVELINELDSFGEPLKPLLVGMAEGLE